MNKSTIIIKGVRAAKFSIKTIQGFLFLNGLVSIYNFNKVNAGDVPLASMAYNTVLGLFPTKEKPSNNLKANEYVQRL